MDKQTAINWVEARLRSGCTQDEAWKAGDMAIKALEKQIPKKVIYEYLGRERFQNLTMYASRCPSCNLQITSILVHDKRTATSLIRRFGLNTYCNRCGQKLDWEE